ncbi:hypothetical protein KBY57_00975 [Cyanobium sp. Aljojuca 7D2]|uniref:hypothetical protein n=1 Tax=Cyanobium sp. Aljojuca 7D2 TaxID=2823698 RepID=UPI0020CFE7FC|nr:hypothetical protein [Cyanobium sp. Aljojuca 7D2]MCP9889629.1 hypothetical protein [Cyanobium sp. Aljojuca 7D2]
MAYWWVNHKQTYRQETEGGYIWSPKTNANGARNVSYDNLTRSERGDVVFSYANGKISQIGLVETAAITAQKPPEFGSAGDSWSQDGWVVRVNWQPLQQPLVPQTFFELLQPLLPERHSPISTSSGRGNQGVYLAGLGETLAARCPGYSAQSWNPRAGASGWKRGAIQHSNFGCLSRLASLVTQVQIFLSRFLPR